MQGCGVSCSIGEIFGRVLWNWFDIDISTICVCARVRVGAVLCEVGEIFGRVLCSRFDVLTGRHQACVGAIRWAQTW